MPRRSENTYYKKLCPKCNQVLMRTEFYKNKSRGDGLASYCKKCRNKRSTQWNQENSRYHSFVVTEIQKRKKQKALAEKPKPLSGEEIAIRIARFK